MDIVFILLLISYCASLVILLSIPLRRRAVALRAGSRLYPIAAKKSGFVKGLFIVFLCAAIIFFVQTRYFSVFVNIAFCGTAVLGIEFAARLFTLLGLSGAWQNAVICGTDIVLYDEIVIFPVLQLPPEEQASYPKNVLTVETKNRGQVNLFFPDEASCKKTLEVIFAQRPELKPDSE
jgi:hypothetical protein